MTTLVERGIGLTGAQQRIVEWDEGPLVVIAGAGTGKTRVIVERVAHLLRTKGVPDGAGRARKGALPAEPATVHDPFAGPLVPKQIRAVAFAATSGKASYFCGLAAVCPAGAL